MDEVKLDIPVVPRFLRANKGECIVNIEDVSESELVSMADEWKQKLIDLHRHRKEYKES